MISKILDDDFKIIAYRGGTGTFGENSIEAIRESIKSMSNVIIELDLQLTKDHEIIAFHDFDLDKLTNAKGKVKDFTINQLKHFYLKNPNGSVSETSKISTLNEIFKLFPNQRFVLDFHENSPELIEKAIEIMQTNQMENNVAILSMVDGLIANFKKIRPNWVFVADMNVTKKFLIASFFYLEKFIQIDAQIIFIPLKLGKINVLNQRMVNVLRKKNIKIWSCQNFKPYENINSILDLNNIKRYNIDAVYTDNPKDILP